MKHNKLIHNLAEEDGENMFIKIPALLKEHLGVYTKFSNIHRNGLGKQDKLRSITGRLINFPDKEKILSVHKGRKDKVPKLPFYITPQQTIQITEYRKKLVEVSTKYREDNVRIRILCDELVFQNGTVYRDEVTKPRAKDLLLMDEDEKQKYESLDSVKCGPVTEAGNKFSATSAEVYSMPNCGASIRKWSVIWRVPEQIITSLGTDFATSRVRYTKIIGIKI